MSDDEIEMDYNELGLAQQLLDRQGDHTDVVVTHMMDFLERDGEEGTLSAKLGHASSKFRGFINRQLRAFGELLHDSAQSMKKHIQDFQDVDDVAAQRLAKMAKNLNNPTSISGGTSVGSNTATLGSARVCEASPSSGNSRNGTITDESFIRNRTEFETLTRGLADEGSSASCNGVSEVANLTAELNNVAYEPTKLDTILEGALTTLHSASGPMFPLLGVSLIDTINKRVKGPWTLAGRARPGWGSSARATAGIAENLASLPDMLASWQGASKDAFVPYLGMLTDTIKTFSSGCSDMKGLGDAVATMCDQVADAIKVGADYIHEEMPFFELLGQVLDGASLGDQFETGLNVVKSVFTSAPAGSVISLVEAQQRISALRDVYRDMVDALNELETCIETYAAGTELFAQMTWMRRDSSEAYEDLQELFDENTPRPDDKSPGEEEDNTDDGNGGRDNNQDNNIGGGGGGGSTGDDETPSKPGGPPGGPPEEDDLEEDEENIEDEEDEEDRGDDADDPVVKITVRLSDGTEVSIEVPRSYLGEGNGRVSIGVDENNNLHLTFNGENDLSLFDSSQGGNKYHTDVRPQHDIWLSDEGTDTDWVPPVVDMPRPIEPEFPISSYQLPVPEGMPRPIDLDLETDRMNELRDSADAFSPNADMPLRTSAETAYPATPTVDPTLSYDPVTSGFDAGGQGTSAQPSVAQPIIQDTSASASAAQTTGYVPPPVMPTPQQATDRDTREK